MPTWPEKMPEAINLYGCAGANATAARLARLLHTIGAEHKPWPQRTHHS
jgi:hypothetical protein